MKRAKKKLLIPVILFAVIIISGIFIAQNIIKAKIETALKTDLPENIQVDYSDLELNLFKGQLKITNLGITKNSNTQIVMKQLQVSSISYWAYLFNNQIKIGEVKIENPVIKYIKTENKNRQVESDTIKKEQFKSINIEKFEIVNGEISVRNSKTDSLMIQAENLNIIVKNLVFNQNKHSGNSPFVFDAYEISFENFYSQVSEYENLTIEKGKLNDEVFLINDLKFFTKYSKHEFNKIISVERDYFNVAVDTISVNKPEYFYTNDSILNIKSNQVVFSKPDVSIYRNKLVADDHRNKPLYSEMIRNLNFNLTLDSILIKQAHILYSEKVRIDRKPGEISISNLNAQIKNVGNTYSENQETIILAQANFMDSAPIKVDWRFNIHSLNDRFVFKAEIDDLKAESLNRFTEPNLNKRIEGELERIYFTIDGNKNTSSVNLKVKYEHFDIIALKKNKKEKNKLFSRLLNTLVSKSSMKTKDGYNKAVLKEVKRNKIKSVFNFIMHNMTLGLLKAMTLD